MYSVILVTASSKVEAEKIAKALLKNKCAACVNIITGIKSLFRWQGKIDAAKEILLVIKSKKSKLPKIIKLVKSMHSYEVPEIIALPVIGGEKKYLRWINDSVS
ncbi:MAG: divalent-cation tolerance protein CutA [Candidatus Omnitrophica bacterium]|jgi:periplasmic divalent cation tolerance protein|nr:divalent-cation tolerance protein CutA [Candidatus Omnitrophota bacterium]